MVTPYKVILVAVLVLFSYYIGFKTRDSAADPLNQLAPIFRDITTLILICSFGAILLSLFHLAYP